MLSVRRFQTLENASPIGKQVRNYVRILDPRVFRLNMVHTSAVLDVVIESDLRGRGVAHVDGSVLAFKLHSLVVAIGQLSE